MALAVFLIYVAVMWWNFRVSAHRHALHAARVTFPHPDGSSVTAEAPLPADLAQLLDG